MTPLEAIDQHCKQLRLTTIGQIVPEALTLAGEQDWSLESFLVYLLEEEINQRQQRRIERYLRQALDGPDPVDAPELFAAAAAALQDHLDLKGDAREKLEADLDKLQASLAAGSLFADCAPLAIAGGE